MDGYEPIYPEGDTTSEENLWQRIKFGDEKAREEVIISYRPMVFWLAKKFHVPSDSYQDLIQEGMVALIEAVDRYDAKRGAKFITYAYYRIKGRMVNFLERSEARAPEPVDIDDHLYESNMASFDDEGWLIDLEAAIRSLSEREVEIVKAVDLNGLSVKEVAREKGVDISYIYRLRRRAIAKLKKILEAT